jgi:hypothetical protein
MPTQVIIHLLILILIDYKFEFEIFQFAQTFPLANNILIKKKTAADDVKKVLASVGANIDEA